MKGGFLLSSVLGITQRSTMDLDFSVRGMDFIKDATGEMILGIIRTEVNDDISYRLLKITETLQHRHVSGFKISMVGLLDNIKVPFSIDLAMGDPITPQEIRYDYQPLLLDKAFDLKSYNIETVLAEKIQSIMDWKASNGRMKDFYDIYIISKCHHQLVSPAILKDAIKNTFEHRHTEYGHNILEALLNHLEADEEFIKRWMNFVEKNDFVDALTFGDIRKEIIELATKMN